MVQFRTMPDIEEYVSVADAAKDDRIPYSAYWVRKLAQDGRVRAVKVGTGYRASWLIHMPSLLEYCKRMEELGHKKHHP